MGFVIYVQHKHPRVAWYEPAVDQWDGQCRLCDDHRAHQADGARSMG